jgi:hypothetical protein
MIELIEQFKKKWPRFNDAYFISIVHRFAVVGGGKDTEKDKKGKYFSTVYELFLYLAFWGLSKNRKEPFKTGSKRRTFQNINEWTQHKDLVDFLIMSLLAKSSVDFNEIEKMNRDEIDAFVVRLERDLEEYANAGFELLHEKMQSDPNYFKNNDNCFIDLLSDM